jgi:hypothetical protein
MLAVFFIILIFGFFTYVFSMKVKVPSRAAQKMIKRVEITNLTPVQVTIFWQTDAKESGWVIFGETEAKMDSIVYDERDLPTKQDRFINHFVTLRNLKENTRYFFQIISDNKLVKNTDGNASFVFVTPKVQSATANLTPIYGKVTKPNGEPEDNAVALVKVGNAHLLSALTKTTGEWLIPLNNTYDKDSLVIKVPKADEEVNVEIINEDKQISIIRAQISRITPLPQTVVIGNNYTFMNENNVLSAYDKNISVNRELDIIYPKENAIIPGRSPLIKGVSAPRSEVLVVVEAVKTISSRVTTDKDGIWQLLLPESLVAGEYRITATTTVNGRKVTKERKFTIAKSGEQVLGEATPEAIPTELEPTPIKSGPTVIPTATAPVSGNNFKGFVWASASFIVIGLGILLAF